MYITYTYVSMDVSVPDDDIYKTAYIYIDYKIA